MTAAVDIEKLIDDGWRDHADHPREVAQRLATSAATIDTPRHVAPFARIVTHVYGEHLGECDRGIAILESLLLPPAVGDDPSSRALVKRSVAALRVVGGDAGALAGFPVEDRAWGLSIAASALAGLGDFRRALDAYAQATDLAPSLPAGSASVRALAMSGNNLAVALESKASRDEAETEGMVAAARAGLEFWRKAGTWLEEERA